MKATRPNRAAIEQQLGRLAATPAPAPRPLFARQLEERLRGLAAGELMAAPAPARPATVHRLPVRWMAGVAAAAALVAAVLAVRPGGSTGGRVTQVGSHGEVGPAPTTTTPASTPPSVAATTTTSGPAPTSTTTTARPSEPSTSSSVAVATSAPTAVTPTSNGPTTTSTSIAGATTTVTARPVESITTTRLTSTTASPSTTSTTVRSPSLACTPGLATSPQVSCTWNRTTSGSFASYRLQRTADGSTFTTVFTSTEVATTNFVDTSVTTPSSYSYRLDILDSTGSVVTSSNVATVACCHAK